MCCGPRNVLLLGLVFFIRSAIGGLLFLFLIIFVFFFFFFLLFFSDNFFAFRFLFLLWRGASLMPVAKFLWWKADKLYKEISELLAGSTS